MLEYEKLMKDGAMEVALKGHLDTDTAPGLEEDLLAEAPNLQALNLDMAKLEYISSAGLRTLLKLQRALGDKMSVTNVPAFIMDIFEMTGFCDVLTIVDAGDYGIEE